MGRSWGQFPGLCARRQGKGWACVKCAPSGVARPETARYGFSPSIPRERRLSAVKIRRQMVNRRLVHLWDRRSQGVLTQAPTYHPMPPRAAAPLRHSGIPGIHLPPACLDYAGTVLACSALRLLSAILSGCTIHFPLSPCPLFRICPVVPIVTGSLTVSCFSPPLLSSERGSGGEVSFERTLKPLREYSIEAGFD